MASLFPLAPTVGDTFVIKGSRYEYNAALGWVEMTSNKPTPVAPTTYTRGTAQFTGTSFGFQEIYENIFDAYQNNTGIFRNPGTNTWDVTSYVSTLWGGLNMLRVTPTNVAPNLTIDIPAGAINGLMWLRLINDNVTTARENTITYRSTGSGAAGESFVGTWADNQDFPIQMGPYAYLNNAGGFESFNHFWVPFVLPDGATQLQLQFRSVWSVPDGWISGLAFTDNPRGFAATNGITLHREGTYISNVFAADWGNTGSGFHRARFQGAFTNTAATAPVNQGIGPKRISVQCDINGNNKRIAFFNENNDPNTVKSPWYLRPAGGTWITPENTISDIDWVTIVGLNNTTNWGNCWVYDIPAAEVAAAASTNVGGGTLDTCINLEMYNPSTNLSDVAYVFTYDA